MSARRSARATAAWIALLGVAGCAGGPGTGSPEASGPPVVVVPEADATTVAAALVVTGSGWEGSGMEGLTLLAARALVEEVRPELEALGAEAAVRCDRWAFVFTVVAPTATWERAGAALSAALMRAAPPAAAVERARASLGASLALDRANPAWQARLAAGRALYAASGEQSAWARPGCGVVESLPLFDDVAVRQAASLFVPIRSAAVVGAVTAAEAEAAADTAVTGAGPAGAAADTGASALGRKWLRHLTEARGALVRPLATPGLPSPGRVYVERNTVTAWVSVAWPFGRYADPEAMRLVGRVLEEVAGPGVSHPDRFDIGSEVILHGAGGALVVTAVVAPARAAEVAGALEAAALSLREAELPAALVTRVARRHLGDRLRALATPEARATRLALALARGEPAAAWPAPGSFTAHAAWEAAQMLGAPARSVVGPRAARAAVVP